MKFFVNNIESYSEKCNKVYLNFVNSKFDKLNFGVFIPTSFSFEVGKEQDIPKFICDNIFHNEYIRHTIEKQIVKFKYDTNEFFTWFEELEKSNVEELRGKYVGEEGMEIIAKFSVVKKLFEKQMIYPSFSCWKTGWLLEDENKNVFIVYTSSEKLVSYLKSHAEVILDCVIHKHETYMGVRQNILKVFRNSLIENC